ncbi:MAG: 16S rRNA (guanine(966)-N(2))-methyltransferase RsmD [Thermoleophilia bacterium]|nr:16S rRNA (guanine(966)-N(2))-methyltransferase RsmD [Thermoleophilia bacterium]
MRIVAGQYRSRRLVTPPGKGVRPTSDRAREAIFASLGASVVDAHVLDLFAGSGALGLEALSRGAASCLFVERNAAALAAIRTNLDTLGESSQARIERGNAMTVLQRLVDAGDQFDLVLVDPPYEAVQDLAVMLTTLLPQVLTATGSIVFETAVGSAVPIPGLVERYNRRIAAAEIVILQRMETV